jgi:hypothetical protein
MQLVSSYFFVDRRFAKIFAKGTNRDVCYAQAQSVFIDFSAAATNSSL